MQYMHDDYFLCKNVHSRKYMQNGAALHYGFNHNIIDVLSMDYIPWIKTSAAYFTDMDKL